MFGSDWPVCELAASYERVHHALREAVSPLSGGERDLIFGETARQFYGWRGKGPRSGVPIRGYHLGEFPCISYDREIREGSPRGVLPGE